jgi:hypothetical protein
MCGGNGRAERFRDGAFHACTCPRCGDSWAILAKYAALAGGEKVNG